MPPVPVVPVPGVAPGEPEGPARPAGPFAWRARPDAGPFPCEPPLPVPGKGRTGEKGAGREDGDGVAAGWTWMDIGLAGRERRAAAGRRCGRAFARLAGRLAFLTAPFFLFVLTTLEARTRS